MNICLAKQNSAQRALFSSKSSILKAYLATLLAMLVMVNNAFAEEAIVEAEAKARFEIKSIVIDGNTLLPNEKLQQAVAPFLLPDATIETLQSALIAVEKTYIEAGYSAIKAVLPEQESDVGVFHISVIEAKLASVRVTGNQHLSTANILNSAPDLVVGQSPNLLMVAKTLRIANESFAKHTRVVIAKSEKPSEVDAELKVQDGKPWRFAVSLDNTGTIPTGRQRLGFVFQHANLFDLDHAMAAQYTTSPEYEGDVKIFGLSYRIPVYRLADSIDISAGHSDVSNGNITTTAGIFGISGSGDFVSVNYNHALPVWRDIEQRISLGLNWRSFQSDVVPQGGGPSLIPDLTSAPASITYGLNYAQNDYRWLANVSLVHNLPSGSDGNKQAYNQFGARPGAASHFNVVRYNLGFSRPISSKFNVSVELNGQHTDDMLIPGEQFGVGGAGSVRGFDPRELTNDKGYRVSAELNSTAIPVTQIANSRLIGTVFFDHGYVERNNPLPGELDNETISAFGAGFRLGLGQSFQLKFDLARALNGSPTYEAGEYQGHFDMVYLF